MAAFDFVAAYRSMQPSADREIVNARSKSFAKVQTDAAKSISRVVDLAYFAYHLPHPVDSDAQDWFGEILRIEDPTFSIQLDVEEAARIATLVLQQRLHDGYFGTPIVVQAAAFAGKRQSVDGHQLALAARQTLANLVKKRGTSSPKPETIAVKSTGAAEALKKYSEEEADATDVLVFEAAIKDYNEQLEQLSSASNKAIETVWAENRRLAEEIDLLWWHIGGQSFLLNRSIDSIPAALRPIVIGMDVGQLINAVPGPYGAYGIIRRALGSASDAPVKLSEAVKELNGEFAGLVEQCFGHAALAPIHSAVADRLLSETAVSAGQFKKKTGLSFDVKLTAFDMAVQAYHERILTKLDWIK